MSDEMPPIGKGPENATAARLLLLALAASLCGAGWLAYRRHKAAAELPAVAVAPVPAPAPVPAAPPVSALKKSGLHRAQVTINGPLETALVGQLGRGPGARLSQVVVRALAWWVDVPSDLRKGDRLDVLFEERPGEEPVVHALRFQSGKMGRTFHAYRYKAAGASFARLYQSGGEEVELRLADAPLDDYEQVTSLLRDGRGHKGVDFKTPTGTEVKAPFDGVVTRRNWNVRLNGNSLEIRETGGTRTAMFLHLSEIPAELRPGEKVTRGQPIALTGNTGHSFAPHLHYQMQSGNTVLDPFQSHQTTRRALPDPDKPAFQAETQRLDGLLDTAENGA